MEKAEQSSVTFVSLLEHAGTFYTCNIQSSRHHATLTPPPASWTAFHSHTLWQNIHSHLKQTPDDVHFAAVSDDLVGFFSSAPQQRLLDAVISLCTKWQLSHSTITLTIDIHSTGNPLQQSHIGRHYRYHPQQRTLDTLDIPTIVQCALHICIFPSLQRILSTNPRRWHRQSTISGPLQCCNYFYRTHMARTYTTFLSQPTLALLNTRHVDNRHILFNDNFINSLPLLILSHPDFYGHPAKIITFQPPVHPWQK